MLSPHGDCGYAAGEIRDVDRGQVVCSYPAPQLAMLIPSSTLDTTNQEGTGRLTRQLIRNHYRSRRDIDRGKTNLSNGGLISSTSTIWPRNDRRKYAFPRPSVSLYI